MQNPGLPDINTIGEKYVEQWLIENGYSNILKEQLQVNEHGFVATGKIRNILIQVRTFVHPHKPYKLSDYQVDLLTRRAIKLKLVGYVAYVVLDKNHNLMEEIAWEKLS